MRTMILALALVFMGSAFALRPSAAHQLKLTDVRNTMEEMFSYHVEAKEISAVLVKRSFKNFIDQFDSQKIYLTEKEIRPFLELTSAQIETIVDHYYGDEYPEYAMLNKTVVKAIERSRQWRKELYADFVADGENLDVEFADTPQTLLVNPVQLKKRLRMQLVRLFKLENKYNDPNFWTVERRQKVSGLYERRLAHFESSYLGKEHELALHILKAMARGLDAHTAYFSPEEAIEMRSSLEKQFEGVGIVLREGLDGIEIAGVVNGGPAERCKKIIPGDILVEIDGSPVEGASFREVLEALKGQGTKEVVLGLKRSDEIFRVDLRREKILMQDERLIYSAEPFADGIIGKLTLPSFYESLEAPSCEADIRAALRELKKQGKLNGLVLDLRSNLGGFLSQAVKVAGLFMTSGVVVISKYAEGEIQYLRNLDPRLYYNGPLVVLTSKMSASAAEIVAQALQDYGVGVVVGDERTYGKGTIQYQTVTDSGAEAFFKVTVGRYYTVSGRSTQIEGVKADIIVPTNYAPYNIGERYLDYALKNDQVSPAYADKLLDVPTHNRSWFHKNYLPFLQKKESQWFQMLPILKTNSAYRLEHDPNFKIFLKKMDAADIGESDLQMEEAVHIIQDMNSIAA
jgi:carboxyl-terminal processing protease